MEAGPQILAGISLPLIHGSELVNAITIPLFTGAIGYVINWTGVWMLFYPVRFAGFRLPGLAPLVTLLPRRVQQVPGFMHGAVGWQGIIPSRAAKMGSIAVDKGIAKLGSPSEFYRQLDPEGIAEHILATSREDIRDVVERIMRREHGTRWDELPPRAREAVHSRVQEQLPQIVREVTDEIGDNIDQLLDVKLIGDPSDGGAARAGEPRLPGRRRAGAAAHHQPRIRLRPDLRDPGRRDHAAAAVLVGAAGMRRRRRLGYEPPRHLHDLRAGRAAPSGAGAPPRAVPAPPGRGRRYVRRHHRGRHRHDREHR